MAVAAVREVGLHHGHGVPWVPTMATWCTNGYTSESITPWLHHPSDLWGRRPAYFTLSLFALGICICEKHQTLPLGKVSSLFLVFAPHWYLYLYRNGWICICWELDPTGEGLLHSRMTKCDEYPQFVKIKIDNVDDGWWR